MSLKIRLCTFSDGGAPCDAEPCPAAPTAQERRRLREAASLTRAQLASRVGVTGETVRGWETGRVTPRGRKGEKYAKLLNSLGDESEVTPPQDDAVDDDVPEPAPPAAVSRRTARAPRKAAAIDRKRPPAAKDRGRGPATVPDHGHTPVADHSRPPAPHHSRTPAPHHSRTAVPHGHRVILTERRRTTPPHRPDDAITALTPDQAFDALYAFCAPALVRQTYLLTGRRELARESVERAFQIAWQRWPEVARDATRRAGCARWPTSAPSPPGTGSGCVTGTPSRRRPTPSTGR